MNSYHFFLKDLFDTGMYGGACCTYSLRLAVHRIRTISAYKEKRFQPGWSISYAAWATLPLHVPQRKFVGSTLFWEYLCVEREAMPSVS